MVLYSQFGDQASRLRTGWFQQLLRLLCVAILAMSMVACDDEENEEDDDDDDDDQVALVEGRFVDSPVAGLGYSAGGGDVQLTTSAGFFSYAAGQSVVFSHGNTRIGGATGQGVITPNNIDTCNSAENTTTENCIINIARFLITHKDNGASVITLDAAARDAAGDIAGVNFDVDPDLFGTESDTRNPDLQEYLVAHAGTGRSGLASESEAQMHLQCSELDIAFGREPDGMCDSGGGNDGGNNGGDGGNNGGASLCLPMDPTGLLCAEQLCAIPSLGQTLVESAGGSCPSGGGPALPIDVGQLCAIPGIGAPLVAGLGGSC